MNPKSGLCAGLLFFLVTPVFAEVYRNVDSYGNVTYSDEPSEGSETVEVKPVTTITLPKPEVVQETDKLREEVQREGAAYESVSFAYPDNNQAFHSGSGDVQFEVRSTPGLQPGHKYEVTLDGQPVGQSSSGSRSGCWWRSPWTAVGWPGGSGWFGITEAVCRSMTISARR